LWGCCNADADANTDNADADANACDADTDAGDANANTYGNNHTATNQRNTDPKTAAYAVSSADTAVSGWVKALKELEVIRNSRGNSRVPCF